MFFKVMIIIIINKNSTIFKSWLYNSNPLLSSIVKIPKHCVNVSFHMKESKINLSKRPLLSDDRRPTGKLFKHRAGTVVSGEN